MYLVFDLETSMFSIGPKGKSDPFFDKILAIGLKYSPGVNIDPDKRNQCYAFAQDYMRQDWLDGIDLLIGHNIAFDLEFIWRNHELLDFFRKGGRIWDTQLVEYILSGQRHKYPALRDIAVNRYSRPERVKHLEGRDTQDVPIELLLEDVRNDVLDTEAVALQQYKIAKENGLLGLIWSQMDARLMTVEEQMNGFKIDLDLFEQNKKDLQNKLEPLTKEINEIVKPYWPEHLEFNMNSPKQLVDLFFGGSYNYKEKIQEGTYKNGNPKFKTIESSKPITGLGMTAHKDWKTPTGNISVNENVLGQIARKS